MNWDVADPIIIQGLPLSSGAIPKCAMCGSSKDLGRIRSPGLSYGVVLCPKHAPLWTEAIVNSVLSDFDRTEEVMRDLGLR